MFRVSQYNCEGQGIFLMRTKFERKKKTLFEILNLNKKIAIFVYC